MKGDGCCEGKERSTAKIISIFIPHSSGVHVTSLHPHFYLKEKLHSTFVKTPTFLLILIKTHNVQRPIRDAPVWSFSDVWCLISKTLQELPPLLIRTLSKDSDSLHLYSLALLYSWVGIHSAKKSTKVIRTSLMCVIKCQDISIVNREVNWSCWLLNSSRNLQDTTGGIIKEIKPVEQSHSNNISKVYWFLCFLDKVEIRKCLNSKNLWSNYISNLQRTCHLCPLW